VPNTLKSLEDALAGHVADLASIRWDPALDLVRDDRRYQQIVDAVYGRD
jgi:hypothetical protein